MTALANLSITTAVTAAVTTPIQIAPYRPESLGLFANFTWTSPTVTDGSLAINDGTLGALYRCKITTVGTYSATTLSVYATPGSARVTM